MRKLTEKQIKFCQIYAVTGNATKAYIEAGYKGKTEAAQRSGASEILTNPNIKSYLSELTSEAEKLAKDNAVMGVEEVLEFLTNVIHDKVTETVVVGGSGGADTIERTPAVSDKIRAASEILKRHPVQTDVNLHIVPEIIIGEYADDDDG